MIRPAPRWLAAAVALWPAIALAVDVEPAAPTAGPPQPSAPAAPPATPAPTAPAPSGASVFVPPEPACLEWTDGCRVCQKPAGGQVACSNIGPTCLPQAVRCTRR